MHGVYGNTNGAQDSERTETSYISMVCALDSATYSCDLTMHVSYSDCLFIVGGRMQERWAWEAFATLSCFFYLF